MKVKTKNEVKAEFAYLGKSLAEWARERGYKRRTVYAVVSGELKGGRGISHKIAVELGMKHGAISK
ncbi:MAG: DNA-binding protein [Methylovulum sp.]